MGGSSSSQWAHKVVVVVNIVVRDSFGIESGDNRRPGVVAG